jgi:hypothetical protein
VVKKGESEEEKKRRGEKGKKWKWSWLPRHFTCPLPSGTDRFFVAAS